MNTSSHFIPMDFATKMREIMVYPEHMRAERLKEVCYDFACRAAGVAGKDPTGIDGLVWYRHDGWNHGGSAITWRERAEELETREKETESLMNRLGESLAHMEHCRYCGEDSWASCDRGGKEASKALEEWRNL